MERQVFGRREKELLLPSANALVLPAVNPNVGRTVADAANAALARIETLILIRVAMGSAFDAVQLEVRNVKNSAKNCHVVTRDLTA
jgi:hypothetical protein